ncbi:Clu domain-containing protein [Balamuthia mandrillaris]
MEEEEAASRRQELLAQIERKRRELAELEKCFLASEPHAQPSAATSTSEVADSVQSSTSVVVVATPSTTKGLGATAEERDEEADVYAEHTYEPMVHLHVAESDSSATEEEGGYEICPSSFSSFSSSVSASSSSSSSSFSSSSSSAKLSLFGSNNATNAVTQKQPMHALDESAAEEETENNVSYEVYPSFDHERDDAFKAATTPKPSFALLQADSEVDGYEEVVQVDHQKTTIRASLSSSSSSYSYSSASTSCSETTTRVRKDSTSSSSPNSTTKERRRKRRTRRKYSNNNKKEEQGATSTLFPYNSATSKSRRDRSKRARRWQALHAMNRNDTRQLDGLDNSLWNKHFQAMLALEDNEDKYSKLAYLAHDMSFFAFLSHAAEVYGRIIISERFLPYDDKTIKPLSMGGVAGGEKYQCRGMLFKFAVDTEYKSGCWMYGFCHPNDTNAMKAAAHELRSLARIVDAEAAAEGIFVPLMTIVDYRGFRLTAVSILPISHKTICYGSHDAGRTVHADYEVFNECLSSIFQRLNLKPHIVKNVTLYACGDIEGHWGADGRFYLVDFSRVYCPESTEVASAYFPVAEPRSVFFKMLRPELVVCNKVPLSSDAYSGWQAKDPNWRTHNDEVTEATRNLVDVIIPNFVQDVRKMCQSDKERFKGTYRRYCAECRSIFGGDTPNTPTSRAASLSRPTFTSRHAEVLKDAISVEMLNRQINNVLHQMHTHGINRRYLGLVRHLLLKEPHSSGCMWKYSSLLFTEMAARVCKNIIRALLREKMKALKVPSSEPYRQLVLQLFNLFSGHSTYSHHFWTSNTPPDFPRDVEGAEKKQAQNREEGEDEEKAESEDEKLEGGLEYYIWVAVQEKERRERNEKVKEDVLLEKRNRNDLDSSYDRLLKTNLRWLLPLKCCIRAKFGNLAFTKEELRCKDRTRPFLFQGLFFRRLCSMLGITVADVPAIYDALNGSPPAAVPHPYEWLDPHLLDLEAKVKHMHLIAGSEGQALWLKAQKLADKSRSRGDYDLDPTTRGKVKRLLNFAKEKLLLALSSIPDSVPTLLLLGKVSHKLVMLCEEEENKTREDTFHPYLSTSGSFSFVQHPVTELSAENNINNSLDNLEVQEPTAPSSSINRSTVQPRSYERMDDFRSCVEYFSEGIKMLQKRKTLGPLERRLLRESRLQLAQAICDWSMTSSYFSASPQSFAFDGRSRDETRGRLWMRAWKEFYWALMAKPKKMKPRYQTEVDDVITICHTLNLLQSTEGAATTTTTEDTYQSNNEEHEKEPNLAEQEASFSSSSSHHQTRKKKLGSIVAAIMKLEALRNLESIRGRDGLELRCAQWEQHFQQKMKRIESKHIQTLHSSLLAHSSKAANDVEKRNEEEKGKRTTRFLDASFGNTKRMHTSGLFAHPHHSLLEAGSKGAKKFKPFSAVRQKLTKRLHHRPPTNSVTSSFIAEVGHKEDNNQDKHIADRWLQQQYHHIQKTSSSPSSSCSSSSSSSSVSAASSSTASSSSTAASSSPSTSPPLSCSSFSFIQRERELRRSWEKNILTETNERDNYEKTIRATHDGIPVSVIAQSESEAIKEKEEEDCSADVVVTPKLKRRGTTEFYELMRRGSRLSTGIYDDEDEDDDVEAEEDSDESSYSTTESEDEEETEEEGTSSSDANETSEFSICEELSMKDNVEDTNPADNVEQTEEAEGDRREGKGIDLRKCSIQLQIPKEEKEKEESKKELISSPSSSSSSSTRKHFSLHSLRTKIRKRSRSFNASDANEAMEERQCDAENDEAAKSKSVDALHLSQTTTLSLPSAYSSRSSPSSGSNVCSSISPRHALSQEIVSTHSKHHPSQQRKFSDPYSLSSSVVNTASTSSPSSQHSCQYQYQWSEATRSENAVASANNVQQQRKGSGTAFERLFGARGMKPKPFTKNLSLGRASWLSWFAAGTGLSNHPTDLALVDGKQVAFGSNYKTFLSSSLRHQSNLSLATNLALDGKNGLAQSVVNVNATTISAAELWEVRRANKRRPRSNSSASEQSPEKQREAVDENRSLVVVQDVHRKYLCYDDEKDQVFTRRDLCCLWEWVVIKEGDCIGLRTYPQGKWLCVSRNHQLYIGARNALRSYERWTVTMVHNIVHLRTLHGGYLYPKGPGPLRLTPNTAVAKSFSRWFMDYQNDGSVTLRSYSDGRYLAYNHSDHNKQTLTYAAQPYPWFLKTYNNVDKVVSLYAVVPSSSYDNELAEGDHQKTTRMYLGYRYRSPSPKDNNSRATFVMASWNNVVAQEKTWQQQQRSWKVKKKLQHQQQQQKEKETEKEKEKEKEHEERREDKTDREPETEQTKEKEEEEEVERIGVAWVMERPDSSLTEKLTELYAELELIDGWNTVEKLRSGVFLLDMSI